MAHLYSIGYGNRQWGEIQKLLSDRACTFLIDVRSNPFSKFNPSFNKNELDRLCAQSGIRYIFMGDILGGKPTSSYHFDAEGKTDYVAVAQSEPFKQGLNRLITAHQKGIRACIMCSELKPHECHRCKLIGVELQGLNVEITHIDEKGNDLTQDAVIDKLTGGQFDMFGDPVVSRSRGAYRK